MPRVTNWEDPRLVNDVNRGKVIVYPTDTVFGLGGSIRHRSVLDRVFDLKDRSPEKTVPVLLHRSWLGKIARVSRREMNVLDRFWPGGLTLVVEAVDPGGLDPRLVREGNVALREPGLRPLCDLLEESGPVVGTSANPSGAEPATRFEELDADLVEEADVVVRSEAGGKRPSTVAQWRSERSAWHIHREGPVSPEQIERIQAEP